ncbi:MAG: hypothetical protein HY788_10965 [Deltaproteobacteria bacterium]|nr:hypothetical protein [Deltaproteobacteria bacterium]
MTKEKTLREFLSEQAEFGGGGVRPSIEYWPDDWAEWVSSHRSTIGNSDEYFCRSDHRSSVFCPVGFH